MSGNTPIKPDGGPWTIIKLLQWAAGYLKAREIDSPRATGEILLAHALQCERIDLYLNYDQPLVGEELKAFKALIQRRLRREPVAYILGVKEFWSLDFEVNQDVLIPRPETECLVESALAFLDRYHASPSRRILDLGTGSGAIVVALAAHQPRASYFASDRSMPAVATACRNARQNDLGDRIHFVAADWLSAFNQKVAAFDLIVANPPYIPSRVIEELQPEIRCYEPPAALDGDSDGLECIRKIVGSAYCYLKQGGALMLEIGHDQQEAVRRLASDSGEYDDFNSIKDYSGHDRVVWLHRKG